MNPKTRSAIIGALRRVWGRHPDRIQALKQVEVREFPKTKTGDAARRPLVFYICAQCGGRAKSQETADYPKIHVDHIEPVIPISGEPQSWDDIIRRMFVTPDELQCLCSVCHHKKTQEENATRRENKKVGKGKQDEG